MIAVVSILSVGILSSFLNSQRNARDARRKSDMESISQALEVYKSDKGYYSPQPPAPVWCDQISSSSQTNVAADLLPYKDPLYANTDQDYYLTSWGGDHYRLDAILENSSKDT